MLQRFTPVHAAETYPTLRGVLNSIRERAQWLAAVRACLPEPLRARCHGAEFNEHVLTLAVTSPVWASRLRWLAPELIHCLCDAGHQVRACRVRVALAPTAPLPRLLSPARLSPAARAHLLAAAATMADPQIAASLRRLARP